MTEPWEKAGLSHEEYRVIVQSLGRKPNGLELAMLGVMWSEHCSYKSSRALLRQLPSEGSQVLEGPGGNAGVVDIGHGWGLALKIESHNHPSAIEPYQGAATGVGGIVRDILAMGARPLALLDSLRFGPPRHPPSRRRLHGVVSGIAGYGNAIGVPTVGGELKFAPDYASNPLVNVLCAGLVRQDCIASGFTGEPGNRALLVGNPTGRDGIRGAAFASGALQESGEDQRPAVQVGDPFREKLLIEACLEALEKGLVVGLQDLGAAGLTSAAAEMAAQSGTGLWLDVGRAPRRETGMSPEEVVLSESQERMLLAVLPERVAEVEEVFARWELPAADLGQVTSDGLVTVTEGERVVGQVEARLLAEGAPVRPLASARPCSVRPPAETLDPGDPGRAPQFLKALLSTPGLSDPCWLYQQYDYMVQTNTVVGPGADAAVLRVKGTPMGVALTTDGPTRLGHLDPELAGAQSVAEAARNLTAVGARPVALTDCLNYASPEDPEIYGQLELGIRGMARAARALEVPVVSGNVSLYNETGGKAVPPTPVVGMAGILPRVEQFLRPGWLQAGDLVVLLGDNQEGLGGSAWLWHCRGQLDAAVPLLDLEREKALQETVLAAAGKGLLHSAHDCSEGGLALALARCCLAAAGELGVDVVLPGPGNWAEVWFGEAPGRMLVSVSPDNLPALEEEAGAREVSLHVLGEVLHGHLEIRARDQQAARGRLEVDELRGLGKEEPDGPVGPE